MVQQLKFKKKRKKMVRYFAYGSNMNRERLETRVGKVIASGLKLLEGYNLSFDVSAMTAYANITEADNGAVYGSGYLLTEKQLNTLDRYEGLYNRISVMIEGVPYYTYIAIKPDPKNFYRPIERSYLKNIINGYNKYGLKFNFPIPESAYVDKEYQRKINLYYAQMYGEWY